MDASRRRLLPAPVRDDGDRARPHPHEGPSGTLALANRGDPLAKFVVDTWRTFGLEVAAIGVALLVFSRRPEQARGIAWTVLGIEVMRASSPTST